MPECRKGRMASAGWREAREEDGFGMYNAFKNICL